MAVYLYNDENEQLYVHHDVVLADIPMCVEWVGVAPTKGEKASYAAVGTLSPTIELWDLDVINAVNPSAQLEGHTDAVLGLAWNKLQANVLASCSADCSVSLWDLSTCKRTTAVHPHKNNKVQSLCWNPVQPTVLLSAGYDSEAVVTDLRKPKAGVRLSINSEAESSMWRGEHHVLVSNDKGAVFCYDVRAAAKPVWKLQAHDKACTGISIGPTFPGLLFTCSLDKSVKIWDIGSGKPSLVHSRSSFGGAVFGVQVSAATPYVCVLASEGVDLQVWDYKTSIQHYLAKEQAAVSVANNNNNNNNNAAAAASSEGVNAPAIVSSSASASKKKKKKKNKAKK